MTGFVVNIAIQWRVLKLFAEFCTTGSSETKLSGQSWWMSSKASFGSCYSLLLDVALTSFVISPLHTTKQTAPYTRPNKQPPTHDQTNLTSCFIKCLVLANLTACKAYLSRLRHDGILTLCCIAWPKNNISPKFLFKNKKGWSKKNPMSAASMSR